MIREKILELSRSLEPDVQKVIAQIIDEEYKRLDTPKPRGIMEVIDKIIQQEVIRNETRVS
ncbi:hypothetical protein HYR99_16855 [Candidatus Poribacteria bacterium]|nr:hypothetical protein [Candidatus Poribacteria bacterium]